MAKPQEKQPAVSRMERRRGVGRRPGIQQWPAPTTTMGDADRGPTVTDREILAVFANVDRDALQADDVAAELPIPVETVSDRLADLSERGLLDPAGEDLPGERWRLAPDVDEDATAPDETVETDVEAQASKVTGTETAPRDLETAETPPPDPQEERGEPLHRPAPDPLQAFDPPGTPEEKDRRRGALRRAYAYLRKRGTATRADLETDVYPGAPGGYDDPGEWWAEVVRPGFDALPDVEPAGDTEDAEVDEDGEAWRFTGEQPEAAEE